VKKRLQFPSSASVIAFATCVGALAAACSSSSTATSPGTTSGTDSGVIDLGGDGSAPAFLDASDDVSQHPVDGGFAAPDGGSVRADRFVVKLESATYGGCAGFGQAQLPAVIQGPPLGGGDGHGTLDALSLGTGGTIVVSFGANAIVDGPGPDFIVFENPFHIGGTSGGAIYAEPGEVSVSDDGTTWTTFTCTASATSGPPYGACAGWHPVYSTPDNGISPFDPATAGGDAFDLADLGVKHAKYVRIVDKSGETCAMGDTANQDGFDLDAVAIVNAEIP
jgi:hypothetical protein